MLPKLRTIACAPRRYESTSPDTASRANAPSSVFLIAQEPPIEREEGRGIGKLIRRVPHLRIDRRKPRHPVREAAARARIPLHRMPRGVSSGPILRRSCVTVEQAELLTLEDARGPGKGQEQHRRQTGVLLAHARRESRRIVVGENPGHPTHGCGLPDDARQVRGVPLGEEELEREDRIEELEIGSELRGRPVDLAHQHAPARGLADRSQRLLVARRVSRVDVPQPPVRPRQRQGVGHRGGRIVAQCRILGEAVDGIDAEPVDAELRPEADHLSERSSDTRVAPVQVWLLGVERVQVPLPGALVPRPRAASEGTEPVVRRPILAPHVPVAMLAEPGVGDRGVAGNEVEQHLQAPRMGGAQQVPHVGEGAEVGVDGHVVRDVVAPVGQRRCVDRRQPERIDAQLGEVVEPGRDAGDVADAVPVGILERAHVDLIDHAPAISRTPGRARPGRSLGHSLRSGCQVREHRALPAARTAFGCAPMRFHGTSGTPAGCRA